MPFVTVNDIKLHYEEHSLNGADLKQTESAIPIVFLHGFTLDRRMWQPQVNFFRDHFHIILVDARGHGLSDAPPSGYSRERRVDDLHGFVNALGINRFHLVGLSMGGSTGIGFALKHQQRLASLSLVSTSAAGYNIGKWISQVDRIVNDSDLAMARRKWIKSNLAYYKDDSNHNRDLLEKMMNDYSGAVWIDPMRGRYTPSNDMEVVHAIRIPVALFAGESDSIFLKLAKELHSRIAKSQLITYKDTGHMLNLEATNSFNADLKLFLDSTTRVFKTANELDDIV
ncbi:MAG: alpha/beta fold hydrolase [candidate division Zixibacteria bacterium]|nr:alpha/beta fold hydrolase [candidate division Zixibacteria bacterium]